ncbi:MAG: DUF2938 domain-containing protein [Steroidobacteraceae bacterium]
MDNAPLGCIRLDAIAMTTKWAIAHALAAALVGAGATAVVDLWALLLKHAFSIPSLSYCLLGRWLRHMLEGTFTHPGIAAAPQRRLECTAGWIAHYVIGVVFALAFVALGPNGWLSRPTLLPALSFGIATVLIPFLVMQPAFGLGIAASRTPKPLQARLKSIVTHAVFGIGLYASAVGMNHVLRLHV